MPYPPRKIPRLKGGGIMEVTCTTSPDLCSCLCRLMECFMLKELVVGMFNKEPVGLSCQLLSAIHKLSKLVESKDCKMAKVSRCFIFIQIDCHDQNFVEKEKCRSGSGMTVLLFMGTVIPWKVMSYP